MAITLTAEDLELILQHTPGHPVFVRLANLYIDQGQFERAVEVCQNGLMASPPPQVAIVAHVIEAKALLRLNRTDEALAHLENSTELSPNSADAFKLSGALLHETKMYREAMPFLSNALLRQPDDADTQKRLRECLDAVRAEAPAPHSDSEEKPAQENPPAESEATETQEKTAVTAVVQIPLSPFDQLDLMQGEADESDVVPTMVEVSAYKPGSEPQAAAETAPSPKTSDEKNIEESQTPSEAPKKDEEAPSEAPSQNQPSVAPQAEAAPAGESADEAPMPEAEKSAAPSEPAAPPSDEAETAAVPQAAAVVPDKPQASADAAASEALSPFDQVADAGGFADLEDIGVPTVVDRNAYVPAPNGGTPAQTTPSSDADSALAQVPDAVGFNEDQRDLSAIFRILDGGEESSASGQAAADSAAQAGAESAKSSEDEADAAKNPQESSALDAEDKTESGADLNALQDAASQGAETKSAPVGEADEKPSPESAETANKTETADALAVSAASAVSTVSTASAASLPHASSVPPPLAPHLQAAQADAKTPAPTKTKGRQPPALPKTEAGAKAGSLPQEEDGILSELPDEAIFSAPPRPAPPSAAAASQTADEIARQYEKELRERLLQPPPPTFWRRNWVKISALLACLILIGAGALLYRHIDRSQQADRLGGWKVQTLRALPLATPQSYKDVIELSDRLIGEVPSDAEAQTWRAFGAAALIGHFGENADYRQMAEAGLPAARTHAPGLALAIELWLAEGAEGSDEAAGNKARETIENRIQAQKPEELSAGFERAEVLLLQAQRFLRKNRLEAASDKLNQAMSAAPDHVETYLTSGDLLMKRGDTRDPARARTMYDQARQISPEHVPALVGLVEASLDSRGVAADDDQTLMALLQKARTLFEKSREATPSWPDALEPRIELCEGRLRLRMGQTERAAEILERGRDKWSADRHLRREFSMALGRTQMQAGAYGEAAVTFSDVTGDLAQEKSKRRDHEMDAEARALAARAFIAVGNPQAALKIAADVTGLSAKKAKTANRELAILRGIALYEMRQIERARVQLRSTAFDDGSLPQQAAIYMALIDASGSRENAAQALELLKGIRESSRFWPLAQSVRGRLLLQLKQKKEGRQALMTAMERDPLDYESPSALGQFEAEEGRFDKARTALETAHARNPFHLETAMWLAEIDLLLGDYEAAERILKSAIDKKGSAAAQEALVYLELAKGDLSAARYELSLLRKSHSRSEEAANASILFFALNGDAQNLSSEIKRITARATNDHKLHTARRLVRMGRFAEAKSLYATLAKSQDEATVQDAQIGLMEIGLKSADKKERLQAEKQLAAMVKAAEDKDSTLEDEVKSRILAAEAMRLVSAKKKGAAIKMASLAVKKNPFSPEARFAQASVGMKWGSAEASQEALELAIRLDPAMAEAHAALGLFLARARTDLVRARFCLEMALKFPTQGADKATLQKALAGLATEPGASPARRR